MQRNDVISRMAKYLRPRIKISFWLPNMWTGGGGRRRQSIWGRRRKEFHSWLSIKWNFKDSKEFYFFFNEWCAEHWKCLWWQWKMNRMHRHCAIEISRLKYVSFFSSEGNTCFSWNCQWQGWWKKTNFRGEINVFLIIFKKFHFSTIDIKA